eukprot:1060738-Amphidinium_carterae.2
MWESAGSAWPCNPNSRSREPQCLQSSKYLCPKPHKPADLLASASVCKSMLPCFTEVVVFLGSTAWAVSFVNQPTSSSRKKKRYYIHCFYFMKTSVELLELLRVIGASQCIASYGALY